MKSINTEMKETQFPRLLQILGILSKEQRLNRDELLGRFGIDIRTFQRDIKKIKEECNLDITRSKDGFYYLNRGLEADGSLSFNDIKLFAKNSGFGDIYPNLDDETITDALNIDFSKFYSINNQAGKNQKELSAIFDDLRKAIKEHLELNFYYDGKERLVKPYRLDFVDGIWYLLGDEKTKLKSFSLLKIKKYQILGGFEPSRIFLRRIKENDLEWISQNIKIARILILPKAREYFERKNIFKSFKILKDDNNGILLEVRFAFDDELLNVVKAWIPYIKIIEPQELNAKLKNSLLEYANSI
ncbi:MAG: WYL domain-containing protein [Campylobacter sp.]|uniref:helix-turn-helix transcriptional regulator n=1 Tax=Campylobacter sp. TaxID=205 RepID=UPI002A82EE7C|nr:WYL domain-containing protein [Campylobacter sp.]MCI6564601.1 WYL domain-containing protein [Campylobacter sp.]MCI6580151.1 WYL domain-containing protein [Campylobacter sp.]MCI7236386.1 WYL domain-containing protein [Campylobacter sp.]MCI7582359.1 WYL domain-containing protein [Campylobacter sp.]MDY4803930.1 WYL domain-containing protein [Campylobacter sp.]